LGKFFNKNDKSLYTVLSRRNGRSGIGASNAAFTLSGFDDQERNLTFVKTAF